MSDSVDFLTDLAERNLIQDSTDRDALQERLNSGPITGYCGFDPTASSLHIGNLQSIMLLRRLQEAGHKPIALVGGATGMIGDPSGRTTERTFLDSDVLDANREAIGQQLSQFLDLSEGAGRLVDNRDWMENMSFLEFLRDVGKHITVNTMMAKDSVKSRLERESGISFTEFSYMLLQANDFVELNEQFGCELQVAGSDQWGNIATGVELVRKRLGRRVHGLTAPLIVRADGTKFGKSEGENIWLDGERTSPFRMYQFFLNVSDLDVENLMLRLTLTSVTETRDIVARHEASPHLRSGQRELARRIVALVHSEDLIDSIEAVSGVLFGKSNPTELDAASLNLLEAELEVTTLSAGDAQAGDLVDLFVQSGLAKSKGEVRRNLAGHYVNGEALSARTNLDLASVERLNNGMLLLRRGKGQFGLVRLDS